MRKTVEFFYDCSSPWTYLAFSRIESIASQARASLVWRPILVGGVFNTVNPSVYESRQRPVPAKAKYQTKDLQDWARFYGLKINWPSIFPVNSVKAMRGALVADEHDGLPHYSRRVFESYWSEDRDIYDDAVLEEIVKSIGLDVDEFFEKIRSAPCKERLRANTEELIARGGFGSPTIFVDGAIFFGNDRLILVEHALASEE